jgi:hypothetical protein
VNEDIHYYKRLGSMRKELHDTDMQVFIMNEISSR